MRFMLLEAFGIHPLVIEAWADQLGDELLPIQKAAVEAGVLQGRSLLVVAPGSCGKTVVAEMAMARAVMQRQRAIYLAPTRALAEEKFRTLQARLGALGVNVLISTRDHPHEDARVLRGEFDLLVAVPEKVRALAARNPAVLSSADTIVADELQLLSDLERGPALEMLLAEALYSNKRVQIIGMTAAAAERAELAEWLGAEVVEEQRRPVELRTGVLLGETYYFREHNSGRQGQEAMVEPQGDTWAERAAALAAALASRGEATIVFVRDRTTALRIARRIAASGLLEPAAGLIERLRGLAPTAGVAALRELAAGGVALHHSDLRSEERAAVESAFEAGEVQVVVATSTLAVGVNLPARNVIIDPVKWQSMTSGQQGASQEALPVSDFLAMAGRAGRLGKADPFGRAILIASTPLERDVLWDRYVEAGEPSVAPALGKLAAEDCAVVLGASLIASREGIEGAWASTLTARLAGRGLPQEVSAAARKLCATGLFDEALRPTAMLRPGAGGADAATLVWMGRVCGGDHSQWNWLAVMALACASPYAGRLVFPLSQEELRRHDYVAELVARAEAQGLAATGLKLLEDRRVIGLRAAQRAAKMCLVLWAWADGMAPEDIERTFRMPAARVESIASAVAWLVQVAAEMAEVDGWPKAALQRLYDAAASLRRGYRWGQAAARVSAEERNNVSLSRGASTSPGERGPLAGDATEPASPSRQRKALGTDARNESCEDVTSEAAGAVVEAEGGNGQGAVVGEGGEAGLLLDTAQPDTAWFMGQRLRLTPAEFRMLWRLARAAGKCVNPGRLGYFVFGETDYIGPHQLYPHISRLRKKLAEAAGDKTDPRQIIETVPRRGWRLNLPAAQVRLAGDETELADNAIISAEGQ